jgi:hypothetical protein
LVSLRKRKAIRCIAMAEAFSTGNAPSRRNSVLVVSAGSVPNNALLVRLRTRGESLSLKVLLDYMVVQDMTGPGSRAFRVEMLTYSYRLIDREENEVFAYHWHPDGLSPNREPHLHVSSRPLLYVGGRGRDAQHELAIDKAHFPTGR